MTTDNTKTAVDPSEGGHFLCDDWFDPLETGVRGRIRGFIEELLEAELDSALGATAMNGEARAAQLLLRGLPAPATAIGNAA